MRPLIQEVTTAHTPESLVENLRDEPGIVLLRTSSFDSPSSRYSFVTARPFLTFRSFGSQCEISRIQTPDIRPQLQFGNPWQILDALMARCELLDEIDLPFPLGGGFGYWGYDLKNFTEPKLPRHASNDLELPDCHVGFYDSLVVFDHHLGKVSVISTGLAADGSRGEKRAKEQFEFWQTQLGKTLTPALALSERAKEKVSSAGESPSHPKGRSGLRKLPPLPGERTGARLDVASNFSKAGFLSAVERAQRYIRAGDIYQVNLSQRLAAQCELSGWELFQRLNSVSPAPFSAFFDCDDGGRHGRFQIASSSPELFLRLSGSHIQTRPI